jgi:hypothetical protein
VLFTELVVIPRVVFELVLVVTAADEDILAASVAYYAVSVRLKVGIQPRVLKWIALLIL